LPHNQTNVPVWLPQWLAAKKIVLWGAADLQGFEAPPDKSGKPFSCAISFAIPMNPQIMAAIQNGPNQAYADEYARVNTLINDTSDALSAEIKNWGFNARPLYGLGAHRHGKYQGGLSA
jgi:epoxyqueuosine reductase